MLYRNATSELEDQASRALCPYDRPGIDPRQGTGAEPGTDREVEGLTAPRGISPLPGFSPMGASHQANVSATEPHIW